MINTKRFEKKAQEIAQSGWHLARGKGTSQVGITYELLLGKEPENFEWPDFYGIEIKTKTKNFYKNNTVSLFRATPDSDFFEIKRLVSTYGLPDQKNSQFKVLYLEISGKKRKCLKNGFKFKLVVNYLKKELVLYVYDQNWLLIDTKTSWSFKMLKEKLERKLSYLAFVLAEKKYEDGKRYFKYDLPKLYQLKNFETFLYLIEMGIISLKFSIGVYKGKYRFGEIYDHGTVFCIAPENLYLLFDEMKYQSIQKVKGEEIGPH